MASSHVKQLAEAYPKALPDCKHQFAAQPIDMDTPVESTFKQSVCGQELSDDLVTAFRQLVYGYYAEHCRNLPWREAQDSYQVLVSEVMLQQTQVERVIPKFSAFLACFSTPVALADASLPALLNAWQGLGYNRRALNLQRAAQMIVEEWNGVIPDDPILLQQLPGIGPYTAGAISTFAFNRPNVFLETNIRAVLLHFFFADQSGISDTQLLPVAEAVLDHSNPRNWYNALMDYGSDLKRRFPNPSRRSLHHTIQSKFEGSDRQLRGAILRLLLAQGGMTTAELQKQLKTAAVRLEKILAGLLYEGFITKQGRVFRIPAD